jgi:hypothetical protein
VNSDPFRKAKNPPPGEEPEPYKPRPDQAGYIFKAQYETALNCALHPEDALDVAHDAAYAYLAGIGALREDSSTIVSSVSSAGAMRVEVANVEELARALRDTLVQAQRRGLIPHPAGSETAGDAMP